jgi:outer membrane murein-binding lipoprotein Lpp
MGDMEARVAELRAEVERRELQRKKLEFEVSVARRDADRHKAVADELDQSQLAIQSQIEGELTTD